MNKEWISTKETGQLYLERILVIFDVPILFVCRDFENRKYLCLNIDIETGMTIIAETNIKNLVSMLQNKMPMEKVFRNAENKEIIIAEYNIDTKTIISKTENSKDISEDFLPEKGAFLNIPNEKVTDYILFLNKQIPKVKLINYEKGIDKQKIKCQKQTSVYFVPKYEEVFVCYDMKISETSKKYFYNDYENNNHIA